MRIAALCVCVLLVACTGDPEAFEPPTVGFVSAGAQAPAPEEPAPVETQPEPEPVEAQPKPAETQPEPAEQQPDPEPAQPPAPTSSSDGFCFVKALNRVVGCDSVADGEIDELWWEVVRKAADGSAYVAGFSCRLHNAEPCTLDHACTATVVDDEVHSYVGTCTKALDAVDTSETATSGTMF